MSKIRIYKSGRLWYLSIPVETAFGERRVDSSYYFWNMAVTRLKMYLTDMRSIYKKP